MNLICYRTNETIREATIAEAIESLAAADAAGNSGDILADGIACYVDASADEIADEARAAAPLRFHEKIASTPDLGGKKTRRDLVGVWHGDQKYPLSG